MKNLLLALFFLSFFSCNQSGKNPCDVYIGEWKFAGEEGNIEKGPKESFTIKITSNGPTYLVSVILPNREPNSPIPATCENGILTFVRNQSKGAQLIYFKDGEYIQTIEGYKCYKK